ncbi:MAG: hypothetical protein KUL82_11725 [Bdellovibrio sp.]|nr:hypothetical protein [Bdellovibrio sp.]
MAKKAAKKEAPAAKAKKAAKPVAKAKAPAKAAKPVKAAKPAAKEVKATKAPKAAPKAPEKKAAPPPPAPVKAPKAEKKVKAEAVPAEVVVEAPKKEKKVKIDKSGMSEDQVKWHEFREKYKGMKAPAYSISGQFEAKTPLQHKIFGWGFILSNEYDRLEVLFEDGKRMLISNRKLS